jgi:diguanylate cyclase (GGDEF)-like protein
MSATQPSTSRAITGRAWAYIWLILLLGVALAAQAFAVGSFGEVDWPLLLVLTGLASLAQLFEAEVPNTDAAYFATPIFVFAGVLLLPPWQFAVLALVYHLIEWIKERLSRGHRLRDWYIQPFNIATDILAAVAARWVYTHIQLDVGLLGGLASMLIGTLAALAFVLVNHTLLGTALVLARGHTWRETGMLGLEYVLSDMVFLLLGYIVAVLWDLNPWLIAPALSPLVLMYRALRVPMLEQEAQTDSKTGLLNARYFNRRFEEEFARTRRFQHPLALIMADLDFLRTINNTYGHLAGDVVIAEIGRLIRTSIRDYDFAGRFGGEEFAVALPETGLAEARQIAERIRAAVEATEFRVPNRVEPIRATMSLGVAALPSMAKSSTELTQAADTAVYAAKAAGRNRVELAV